MPPLSPKKLEIEILRSDSKHHPNRINDDDSKSDDKEAETHDGNGKNGFSYRLLIRVGVSSGEIGPILAEIALEEHFSKFLKSQAMTIRR